MNKPTSSKTEFHKTIVCILFELRTAGQFSESGNDHRSETGGAILCLLPMFKSHILSSYLNHPVFDAVNAHFVKPWTTHFLLVF